MSGRFMRGLYGTLKALTFGWIFLVQPWPALLPDFWAVWSLPLRFVTSLLVYASVLVCLLRAAPVIAEFAISEGLATRSRASREPR